MRKERILAVVMAVLMMLSLVPSMVFAAGSGITLEGELKMKGTAAADSTLSADFGKVQPEGVTEEDVSFSWSRKTGEELKELSKEKTYKVTQEDIGSIIVLTVKGLEEKGYTGSLKANSKEVTAAGETQAGEEAEPDAEMQTETGDMEEELFPDTEMGELPPDGEMPETEEDQYAGEDMPYEEEYYEEDSYDENDTPDSTEPMPEEPMPEESYNEEDSYQPDESYSGNEAYDEEELFPISVEENSEDPAEDGQESGEPYAAEAKTPDDSGVLDFGTISAGEEETVEEQYVTIRNTGTNTLNFEPISPEHFAVADITDALEPQTEVSLWVRPRAGIAPGSYEDTITYKSDEGAEVSLIAKVVVADPENPDDSEKPENPENPENPEEPEIPDVLKITADRNAEFSDVTEGYETAPEAVVITLTNAEENVKDVLLTAPVSDQGENSVFDVSGYSGLEENLLPAGGSTTVTIQPKLGLAAGNYIENFSVYDAGAEEKEKMPLVTFSAMINVNSASRGLTVSVSSLDFGTAEEGYPEIEAQAVTVTNAGNVQEILYQPAGTNFHVSSVDEGALVLEPGASVTFYVRPQNGMTESAYQEQITVTSEAGSSTFFEAVFTVTAKVNRLIQVYQPDDISGLKNGTAKDGKSLKLPSTVLIETTNGRMKAKVSWDVKNCSYSAKSTEKQTFTVNGKAVLPDGVQNPDHVSQNTSVKVSVKGYSPKLASADKNQITGISGNGYTTQSKISFTAVGAGMDNTNPRKGDTRYVPLNWTVINTNIWNQAPYTGTFGLAQSGDYTLSVVFKHQKFDGSNWTDTGERDTRKVVFTVTKAKNKTNNPGVDLTPVPRRREAVKTGDDTKIWPFVIALVVAGGCVAGVLIYRKKK